MTDALLVVAALCFAASGGIAGYMVGYSRGQKNPIRTVNLEELRDRTEPRH